MYPEQNKDFNIPIPHWVSERIRHRVFNQDNHDQWHQQIRSEIHQSLQIETGLPHIEEGQISLFYDLLTQSIMEVSSELNIPIPGTILFPNWHQHQYGLYHNFDNRDASVNPHEYAIKYHPQWITRMMEEDPYSLQLEINLLNRHEMFHLWQNLHYQDINDQFTQLRHKTRKLHPQLKPENIDELTSKEMGAEKFSIKGLSQEKTNNIYQFLIKSLLLLLKKQEITKKEKLRKQLGITI